MRGFFRIISFIVGLLATILYPIAATNKAGFDYVVNKPGAEFAVRRWFKYWVVVIPLIIWDNLIGFPAPWFLRPVFMIWLVARHCHGARTLYRVGEKALAMEDGRIQEYARSRAPIVIAAVRGFIMDMRDIINDNSPSARRTSNNQRVSPTRPPHAVLVPPITIPATQPGSSITIAPSPVTEAPFVISQEIPMTPASLHDSASIVSAIRARRRQLEAELAALPDVGGDWVDAGESGSKGKGKASE